MHLAHGLLFSTRFTKKTTHWHGTLASAFFHLRKPFRPLVLKVEHQQWITNVLRSKAPHAPGMHSHRYPCFFLPPVVFKASQAAQIEHVGDRVSQAFAAWEAGGGRTTSPTGEGCADITGKNWAKTWTECNCIKKRNTSTKSATSCKMLPSRQYIAGKGTGKAPPNRGTHAHFFLILPYTAYTIPHCGTHHSNFHFSFDTNTFSAKSWTLDSVGISGKQQLGTTKSAGTGIGLPIPFPLYH